MVKKEIVYRKLKKLNSYIKELETFKDITFEEYLKDFQNRRTVERLIQLIVDVAVDINSHILVDEGHMPPEDAYDSFIKVGNKGIIPQKFAEEIAPSTGERNIIVHEYEQIDDGIIFSSIKKAITMYKKYISYYMEYLEKMN